MGHERTLSIALALGLAGAIACSSVTDDVETAPTMGP